MKFHRLLPIVAVLIAGCTVGPDFQLPSLFGGKSWNQAQAREGVQLPDDWWRLYGDRELTRLVESALKANPSLEAAKARVRTSRALVGVDRARMFPVLDFNGGATTQRSSQDAIGAQLPPGLSIPLERDRYHGSFDLAYEIDLWGENRRSLEASQADANAAEALHDSQRLGLAAEVARQYFLFRGLSGQSAVLRRTIESRMATVGMESDQLKAGLIDELSASRARTELELARNDLVMVERQLGAAGHALAVLCGMAPSDFAGIGKAVTWDRLPVIHPGLRAEVLNRRPDVRAAEQNLRAANARIGVAEAAFYPSFNLMASGGYESLDPGRFLQWQNRIFSLGAGVTAPVFRGGSNRAMWDAAVSRRDEALAEYKNTLLVALREVEDALLDLKSLARSQQAIHAALVQARKAQAGVRERYEQGLMSQLELVDADRTVLGLELQLAQCEANQRISVAQLCKALGGGWKP